MDPNRYFEEHWREIETERLDRYELMFAWRPEHEALSFGVKAVAASADGRLVCTAGWGVVALWQAPEEVLGTVEVKGEEEGGAFW